MLHILYAGLLANINNRLGGINVLVGEYVVWRHRNRNAIGFGCTSLVTACMWIEREDFFSFAGIEDWEFQDVSIGLEVYDLFVFVVGKSWGLWGYLFKNCYSPGVYLDKIERADPPSPQQRGGNSTWMLLPGSNIESHIAVQGCFVCAVLNVLILASQFLTLFLQN